VAPARKRRLELHHVRAHRGRVQAQLVAGGEERRLAERPPQAVHGLVEEVARVVGVPLRPEQAEHLLAAAAALGVGRQEG
jgi:hypothetical protein